VLFLISSNMLTQEHIEYIIGLGTIATFTTANCLISLPISSATETYTTPGSGIAVLNDFLLIK
jgi:hypothetical protein